MENQSAKRKLHKITCMSRGEPPLFIGGDGAADLGTGLAALPFGRAPGLAAVA
jgi:hypothetical protein